jgi:hypothetical protein
MELQLGKQFRQITQLSVHNVQAHDVMMMTQTRIGSVEDDR